jgi:hypothetical protein
MACDSPSDASLQRHVAWKPRCLFVGFSFLQHSLLVAVQSGRAHAIQRQPTNNCQATPQGTSSRPALIRLSPRPFVDIALFIDELFLIDVPPALESEHGPVFERASQRSSCEDPITFRRLWWLLNYLPSLVATPSNGGDLPKPWDFESCLGVFTASSQKHRLRPSPTSPHAVARRTY